MFSSWTQKTFAFDEHFDRIYFSSVSGKGKSSSIVSKAVLSFFSFSKISSMSYTNFPLHKMIDSHSEILSTFLCSQMRSNLLPGPISSSFEVHLLSLSNPLGPAMTKGFLKSLFICLLKAWNMLEGFVGKMNEKLADWMSSQNSSESILNGFDLSVESLL